MFDNTEERTFAGERTDMKLINSRTRQRPGLPPIVGPTEFGMIEKARGAVDAIRLPCGSWIWERTFAINDITVVGTGFSLFRLDLPPSATGRLHGVFLLANLQ